MTHVHMQDFSSSKLIISFLMLGNYDPNGFLAALNEWFFMLYLFLSDSFLKREKYFRTALDIHVVILH